MTDETNAEAGTPVNDAGEASVESQAGPGAEAVSSASVQAPEAYAFTTPEGVTLDADAVSEFSAIAKELGLEQGKAQAIADVAMKMQARQADAHQALVESWVEQVKVDKTLGGDKLSENLAIAKRALDEFGSPELKDVLNLTGLGSHPAVIKFFLNAGKRTLDGPFIPGAPKGAPIGPDKIMFPTMN
jgi:hypothetical protein